MARLGIAVRVVNLNGRTQSPQLQNEGVFRDIDAFSALHARDVIIMMMMKFDLLETP